MIDSIVKSYDFNLRYAQQLVEDVPEALIASPAGSGLENHPAFTIGHLVTGAGLMAHTFHGENSVPKEIRDLCERRGPGDPWLPENRGLKYPPMQELLAELQQQHELVKDGIRNCQPEKWSEQITWRFGNDFPTLLDLTHFMCVTHEAMHLGQLSAWRRGVGLPSALARL